MRTSLDAPSPESGDTSDRLAGIDDLFLSFSLELSGDDVLFSSGISCSRICTCNNCGGGGTSFLESLNVRSICRVPATYSWPWAMASAWIYLPFYTRGAVAFVRISPHGLRR